MENNIKINDSLRPKVDYLRFSLTDRCNLNCIYCTPLEKDKFLRKDKILSYEEIARAVRLFVDSGIKKLRLTGGEPLIKKNVISLIRMLREIKGLEEITMTTNGVYLKGMAGEINKSGLDRFNISLDTLQRKKFRRITGFDCFDDVWAGIQETLSLGMHPLKLNVIIMRGINDDEIIDFSRLIISLPLIIRFIEYFPTNKRSSDFIDSTVDIGSIQSIIEARYGKLYEVHSVIGNGPAMYYTFKGARGAIGFISNAKGQLCRKCNRIRVDCAGRIFPCLFSRQQYDLGAVLRKAASTEDILEFIKNILNYKPLYSRGREQLGHGIEMSSIGG